MTLQQNKDHAFMTYPVRKANSLWNRSHPVSSPFNVLFIEPEGNFKRKSHSLNLYRNSHKEFSVFIIFVSLFFFFHFQSFHSRINVENIHKALLYNDLAILQRVDASDDHYGVTLCKMRETLWKQSEKRKPKFYIEN